MSTSAVRRIKERGGGGGKITAAVVQPNPTKTLTPLSQKLAGGDSLKKSAGKENPRPTSRGRAAASAQKPAIRPMPRIDKASACSNQGGEPRFRCSNSSVPKGRSSSPYEFNRILSDMRKNQGSRVSEDRFEKDSGAKLERSVSCGRRSVSGVRALDRPQQKNVFLRDANAKSSEKIEKRNGVVKESRILGSVEVGMQKSREIFKKGCKSYFSGSENLQDRVLKDANNLAPKRFESDVEEGEESEVKVKDEKKIEADSSLNLLKSGLNGRIVDASSHSDAKGRVCVESRSIEGDKRDNKVDFRVKELGSKAMNGLRASESLKQKNLVEENLSSQSVNKYPSKLHEKLAFLEGKVKRIASDIKRTKEMLDMNNPDSSKVILSDIQEKISGIEKAMGNAVNGTGEKIAASKPFEEGDKQCNISVKIQSKEVDHVKCSVKGLNNEELEARLFPHHKLLRDRTSSKVSSGGFDNNHTSCVESNLEFKPQEKSTSLNPIDENPIALEFLALLSKDQTKVTMRGEMDGVVNSTSQDSLSIVSGKDQHKIILTTDETLDDFDEQQINPKIIIQEETEDNFIYKLNEIGRKTSTGGWFVSEGEAALLAHDDGCCTYYDIANSEVKAEFKPPVGISPNVWRDCWIVRAPGADGCSGRYVVAASAGNTLDSGFCSWDFYAKDVQAFHMEDGTSNPRTALAPLPNNTFYRRNTLSAIMAPENRQWWYKPCGPLIISTASNQRAVSIYDIRDGEQIMKWEVQKPVLSMDYSSPLQWRSRGKVVIAEAESISLWDVSSLNPQPLLSVASSGRKVSALHVSNTDAELGGGVRQRVSSSEAEGNDGVFCTADSLNILDFRHPSGIGLKISKLGVNVQSVFSRGDSIFLGCYNARSTGTKQPCSQVQQFSLRKQRLFSTYAFPETNAHPHYTAITQVWGNSNYAMGVCGLGLFVFDALKDDGLQSLSNDSSMQKVRETIGPDDLYSPSFDYMSSRVLIISRDRPAMWRYLS